MVHGDMVEGFEECADLTAVLEQFSRLKARLKQKARRRNEA